LNTENHKLSLKVLFIPNSIYSTFVIYEYFRSIKTLKINIDIIFVETTNQLVRDLTLNLLSLMPNIRVKIIQTELQNPETTNFFETRKYRKEFIKNNGNIVKSTEYDEILSANSFVLGLLLRYHDRKIIRIVAHGLSDLVKEKKTIKNILIKIYGEIEQFMFGFSINQRFYVKTIFMRKKQVEIPIKVWNHVMTNTLSIDLAKPNVILLLPHILRGSKEIYAQRIVNKLDKLGIKNETIYCKSHPAISEDSAIYDNNKIVDFLNTIESQQNKFVKLPQVDNVEMYLSESTKILFGELSTSMLTCAYLIPSARIALMDFTDILGKSISDIKKDKSLSRNEINKLKNILREFKFLYKSFYKSKELSKGIDF
jgi:hypothetical protein